MAHREHKDKEGRRLPSVTQIKGTIKLPFLETFIRAQCDCVACRNRGGTDGWCGFAVTDRDWGKSREDGSAVHQAIEDYLKEIS